MKVNTKLLIQDTLYLAVGVISAAFGLKSFLLPNHFIDGGATGIALLLTGLTWVPLPVLLIAVNVPFLLLGFRLIGNVFTIKAILAITGLACATALIDFPEVTRDKLLVAVFGGFFLGGGIGMAVRGGGVLDGTEVLAISVSRRFRLKVGDIILFINLMVFSVAAYLLSIETALYSVLTYFSASKTVNFLIEGIEEYTGITIISKYSEQLRKAITEEMGRGVTVYLGKRGFGKRGEVNEDIDILYTVVTRLEINRLNAEIGKIDPNAFVVMNSVKDTIGGMVKKRPLH